MIIARLIRSALLVLTLTLGTLTQAAQMPDCMGFAGTTMASDHEMAVDDSGGVGGCDRQMPPTTKSVMSCQGILCMVPMLSAEMQQIVREPHASFAVPRNSIEWRDSAPAPEIHPPKSTLHI